MYFLSESFYHIYNRGNNRERIFFQYRNYNYFKGKLKKYLLPFVDIISWCLMPNHFHLLIKTKSKDFSNERFIASLSVLLSFYAKAINKQENRTGSLFARKTKAKIIERERDVYSCINYIHQNPVDGKLVKKMEDYEFSSFAEYAGKQKDALVKREIVDELMGKKNDCHLKGDCRRKTTAT